MKVLIKYEEFDTTGKGIVTINRILEVLSKEFNAELMFCEPESYFVIRGWAKKT